MYDYQTLGAPVIGEYTYTLDIGDDYIDMTTSWTIYPVAGHQNPFLSYFSLLPGNFYGFHNNFANPTNISANQQLQISSNNAPLGHMGDLNLFVKIDQNLEAWVDSQYVDPQAPSRVTAGETSLNINLQGVSWGWFQCTEGVVYVETARIDVDFDCNADTTGDGVVNVADILQLIGAWGPCAGCAEDLSVDGNVDVADLLELIANWGNCP